MTCIIVTLRVIPISSFFFINCEIDDIVPTIVFASTFRHVPNAFWGKDAQLPIS